MNGLIGVKKNSTDKRKLEIEIDDVILENKKFKIFKYKERLIIVINIDTYKNMSDYSFLNYFYSVYKKSIILIIFSNHGMFNLNLKWADGIIFKDDDRITIYNKIRFALKGYMIV